MYSAGGDAYTIGQPHTTCSSDSKEGFCTDVDRACSALNVARICGTFGEACLGLDRHPNLTIAEYQSILDKDAMMKEIENRGPIAYALDVGPIFGLRWQLRATRLCFHSDVHRLKPVGSNHTCEGSGTVRIMSGMDSQLQA